MEAFVYRWRELSTNKWYIGYHKGKPDDGYICSSKVAKPLIQANPDNWQRKILRFGTKQEMIDLERKLLKRLRVRTNPNSYNITVATANGIGKVSIAKKLGYDLNKMSATDIGAKYAEEINNKFWDIVAVIDQWIIKRYVEKFKK